MQLTPGYSYIIIIITPTLMHLYYFNATIALGEKNIIIMLIIMIATF